ncbi:hypothetical protein METBIDRAFT_31920 [Metschnikowia bicuspidata var. bicuspidata NRRL YB-4993]|uniref:Uncharacterized protein n=1 Tax=Metschnikowia bicuspidata var. bicuspidata NRRL YB-4993 TaxID=869754 RepID=A0A1A0HBX2_9ASCO|nr:hypothetical protein METBIDRAFT_31920 [Metschnikowia bicuspidata var. bicuspidata NRRL YB-4993]OBA21388.1 hypothetical protein METBIDRAFT_31920 [Metschnikowia bicuspidata var. bicuspidata NRRL YB-4993]
MLNNPAEGKSPHLKASTPSLIPDLMSSNPYGAMHPIEETAAWTLYHDQHTKPPPYRKYDFGVAYRKIGRVYLVLGCLIVFGICAWKLVYFLARQISGGLN